MRPLPIAAFLLPIFSAISPSNAILPSCSQEAAFTISSISYSSYIAASNVTFPDQTTSSLSISFSVTNNATGVQTACSFIHSLSYQGGRWNVDPIIWHPCGERTMSWDGGKGGFSFEVETMASFGWSSWVVGVQQTWVCRDTGVGPLIERNGTASATLVPACSTTSTDSSTSEECTGPDMVAFALLE
ncbi:hypothetical protein L207DRAFT_628247 [Hyaloscypha variabilis F]|uniref:AA1-like domain-containing protein n=1 Tax=Hyaloscypha variabilis (strain UAMH 11265 / GT02V1 / F) TaxID=1149755 RepID=A0A2J6SA38_HYAVF|nr:hypothetical protein L207DRAFT_628247 [Hyaloscypha variabilis F]